jgi:8-amino-7-oxononanoate synthase
MLACAAAAALALVEDDPGLVARLRERIAQFRTACAALGVPVTPSDTAIQPIVVGSAARALEVSARLLDHGLLVPAIRPPTVPPGTSRLRVSLSAGHAREDVERLATALAESLA